MFHSSTQRVHWTFSSREQLQEMRRKVNQNYCDKVSETARERGCQLLTSQEEEVLTQHYLKKLIEFCSHFQPPPPRSALGTATAYYKRFYLQASVMEYHPQNIMFLCAYMAFKVDEYNVSVDNFVRVLHDNLRDHVAEFILTHELLLLRKLKFHLTVHCPFRPVEGFIIDMKTRTPNIPDPDQFRRAADEFLVKSLSTDVSLLYPPSQIALAALQYSSRQTKTQIDGYLQSELLKFEHPKTRHHLLDTLQRIQDMVMSSSFPETTERRAVEKKLEKCKAQELSPKSSRKRKSEEAGGGASKRLRASGASKVQSSLSQRRCASLGKKGDGEHLISGIQPLH